MQFKSNSLLTVSHIEHSVLIASLGNSLSADVLMSVQHAIRASGLPVHSEFCELLACSEAIKQIEPAVKTLILMYHDEDLQSIHQLIASINKSTASNQPRIILIADTIEGLCKSEQAIKMNVFQQLIFSQVEQQLHHTLHLSINDDKLQNALTKSKVGISKVTEYMNDDLLSHSLGHFCELVISQLASMLDSEPNGLFCARAAHLLNVSSDELYMIGAKGSFKHFLNQPIDVINDKKIQLLIARCLQTQMHLYTANHCLFYISQSGFEAAIYIECKTPIDDIDRQLVEALVANVGLNYENVNLFYKLKEVAFNDWLTKIPNRNEFITLIDIQKSNDNQVIALIDINHFSDVNDGLGQDVGNSLLISVANRLSQQIDKSVKKGRITADVFGLIGHEKHVFPEQINALFKAPFSVGEYSLPINVTIGLYRTKKDKEGIYQLRGANIALNSAKASITDNHVYYSPQMEVETKGKLALTRALRSDFEDNKLQLWYQPQVDLVSEQLVGLEALLRWRNADGYFVSPEVFVPLAEYSGLIVDIGKWVIVESLTRLVELNNEGHHNIRMAVNVSVLQFRDKGFIAFVKESLIRFNIAPKWLELEITESVVMDEPHIVIQALNELKDFGVKIAIDDFGTGFSSMSYLQQLPLDRLKVDRSFVNDVSPEKNAFIVETIVTLGRKLGLTTIAEGVEKREQASYMLKLGTDEAQGYLFGKPMPLHDVITYINEQKSAV